MPSRGLEFTEVEEYIEKERRLNPHDIQVYRSHNLPIPECLNVLVEQAFNDGAEMFYFIEDDTVPPDESLNKLLESNHDIVAIDYGQMGGKSTITRSSIDNRILFTGFGCTMIKRKVFEGMEKPWFRSDKALSLPSLTWGDVDPLTSYGLHDVNFGFKARELGFTIEQIEGECKHLKLIALNTTGTNNGCHDIGEKEKISKPQTLNV